MSRLAGDEPPLMSSRGFAGIPAIHAQEPPDALAATVEPATAVAFDGLGLIFANSSTATILALAKSRGSGTKDGWNAALSCLETANAVKTPTRASPGW